MDASDQPTPVEDIDTHECWELLAGSPVGRIGVIFDGAPEIYPVNHLVDQRTIVFRTAPGTKLAGLAGTPTVCYQVDGIDDTPHRAGWSVLVKGHAEQARQVSDPDERHRLEQLPLDLWAVGPKWHLIRIIPTEVTGRRLRPS